MVCAIERCPLFLSASPSCRYVIFGCPIRQPGCLALFSGICVFVAQPFKIRFCPPRYVTDRLPHQRWVHPHKPTHVYAHLQRRPLGRDEKK